MLDDTALDFDIDAIMEGTESTIDMILDDEEAFEAECESTVISDDIDDMAIDNIVGLNDLITDDDIDSIDNGETPDDATDPIDDDAEAGANDPEIFRLQKDLFQNTLLSVDDIKDLKEGMSIEEFTARVLQEAEELPVLTDTQPQVTDEDGGTCKECGCSPCICAEPVDAKIDDHEFDLEKEFDKADVPDIDDSLDDLDDQDEINAPANTPAGPIQPLNDGHEDGEDFSDLPFAPNKGYSIENDNLDDSLSKLEDNEGENEIMFTDEEMNLIEEAYAEGYANRLDELEEAIQEDSDEELTEEEAAIVEAYSAGYENALDEVFDESAEDNDIESVVEDFSDVDEILDSIQEGLEDIEIENEFEGSGINDEQKDANKGMFTGWEKNTDEPGATNQNDTTLPFENVTVKGFSDIEDDSKECMIK